MRRGGAREASPRRVGSGGNRGAVFAARTWEDCEVAQSTLTCRRWAAWCRSTRSRASMGCTASFDGTSVVSRPDAASSTPWPLSRCGCPWTRGWPSALRVLDVEMLAADPLFVHLAGGTVPSIDVLYDDLRRFDHASPRRPGRVDVSTRHGSLEGPAGTHEEIFIDIDTTVMPLFGAGGGPSRSQPALPRATQLPSHPGAHRADRYRARRAVAAGRYVLGERDAGGRRAVARPRPRGGWTVHARLPSASTAATARRCCTPSSARAPGFSSNSSGLQPRRRRPGRPSAGPPSIAAALRTAGVPGRRGSTSAREDWVARVARLRRAVTRTTKRPSNGPLGGYGLLDLLLRHQRPCPRRRRPRTSLRRARRHRAHHR